MLGSDSWIYGKTPPFALELAGRDGKTRLKMLVKEGRVERIESDSPGLEEALARHSGELFSFRLAKELSLLGGS